MNREIKFRAWDGETMWYADSLSPDGFDIRFSFYNGGIGWGVYDNRLENRLCSGEYHQLMQYTGLKDKNGKEIFEGDVVNVPYVDPLGRLNENTVDHIARVVFDFGRFALQEYPVNTPLFKGCHRHTGEYISNFGEPTILHEETVFEIIGNIYENKDLIL